MSEGNGEGLDGFLMTEGEQKGITIDDGEILDLKQKGTKCLVGRLGIPKKLNNEAFKAILLRIWRLAGRILFREIQENLCLFEFEDAEDKKKVMAGCPLSYDRTLLILYELDGKLSLTQMDFSCTPIWVQIHNMPLACMNQGVGNQIGNSLGKVEEVAVAEEGVGWGRYLRVRVAINLFQPLERGRTLFLTGNKCWVSFKYEKLPVFCFWCGRIIHGLKGCPEPISKKSSHADGAKGWGMWLRADDMSRGPVLLEGQKSNRSSSSVNSGEDPVEEVVRGKERNRKAKESYASSRSCQSAISGSRKNSKTADSVPSQQGKCEEVKESKKRKSFQVSRSISEIGEDLNFKKGRRSKGDSNNPIGPSKAQAHLGPGLETGVRQGPFPRSDNVRIGDCSLGDLPEGSKVPKTQAEDSRVLGGANVQSSGRKKLT
jgi:hypothetical protein